MVVPSPSRCINKKLWTHEKVHSFFFSITLSSVSHASVLIGATVCESSFLRLSATAAATVIAAIFIGAATTATVTVATERYQKKYDDEKPDNIVIIENIAKTIHKISSLRRHGRRFHQSVISDNEKRFAFPICYYTMTGRKICYRIFINRFK